MGQARSDFCLSIRVVSFSGDQQSMPPIIRVGAKQHPHLIEYFSPTDFAVACQTKSQITVQNNSFFHNFLFKSRVLDLMVFDHVLLLAIDL